MKQITSLRGLAIILIILFHLNPEHFPYGYFGVEVFLVISGYLLMKSFQKQQMQIRLGEFARKKVLRLFTPVAVIIPLTLLAGMFFLDYTDLATASSTGGYTLIGAANRFLAVIQSDYFAQDSSGNPFLHMWYLAVTVLNRKGSAPSCAYFPIYRKTGRSTPMNTGKSCTRMATTCPVKAPSSSSGT